MVAVVSVLYHGINVPVWLCVIDTAALKALTSVIPAVVAVVASSSVIHAAAALMALGSVILSVAAVMASSSVIHAAAAVMALISVADT